MTIDEALQIVQVHEAHLQGYRGEEIDALVAGDEKRAFGCYVSQLAIERLLDDLSLLDRQAPRQVA